MSYFIKISVQILSVYIVIFLCYFLRKIKKQTIDLGSISELIIYLGSPCLVFTKLARSSYHFSEISTLASAMIFVIGGMALISLIIIKTFKIKTPNIFLLTTMFMNTANIGFPVTIYTFGQAALTKAIILDLTMVILLFSLGIGIISKKYFEWLKIPVIYAAFGGLFFSFSKITIPNIIYNPLSLIGEITIPLMLISLGFKLADLKKIKNFSLPIFITLLRSFGGFALGLLFVSLVKCQGLTREVILLYAGLPAPMMAYILAEKYKQDGMLAAEIVFLSNLTALIILPIIIYLIKYLS